MEVSSSLLVAMMFITILSIGIGNILSALPPLLDKRTRFSMDRVHLAWVLLLLLQHLNLFWQVVLILQIETWDFGGFVFTIAGPIILLLATSLLLPNLSDPAEDAAADYLAASGPGFVLLAVSMVWTLAMDWLMGDGFTGESVGSAIGVVLFTAVAASGSLTFHRIAAALAWVLFLIMLLARSFDGTR